MKIDYQITIGGVTLPISVEQVSDTVPPVVVPPIVVPPVVDPPASSGKFRIGTNDFHWVPLDKLKAFSDIRLYIASGWVWRPGGLFVQPLFQAETATVHGLDDYFAGCKALGINPLPCINKSPDWYAGVPDGSGSNNYPPVKDGKDRTLASSWQDYADFWFQFCARYGSQKHPDSVLRVDTTPSYPNQPTNIKKSGLGLITQVEINNELDRWWDKGSDKNAAYLEPEAHAAMLWACYAACKKADPNMKVIMGGLTGFDMKYLRAMKAWFDKQGVKFQSDAINVHHYSNLRNEYGVWPPTWDNDAGCGPEQDKDFGMIGEVVAFGKTLGLETIVTEFGCDSRGPSWMHIKGKTGETDEQAQARAVVDTFRAYKAAGVSAAYVFTAVNEPNAKNGGLWQNCGLMTGQDDGYKPKPALVAVEALIKEYAPLT